MTTTVEGRIPDFWEALKSPLDYEVSCSALGWTLSHVGDGVALLISKDKAHMFIRALGQAHQVDSSQLRSAWLSQFAHHCKASRHFKQQMQDCLDKGLRDSYMTYRQIRRFSVHRANDFARSLHNAT